MRPTEFVASRASPSPLGKIVRAFSATVLAFYKKRCGASGAVAVVQRTSSDPRNIETMLPFGSR